MCAPVVRRVNDVAYHRAEGARTRLIYIAPLERTSLHVPSASSVPEPSRIDTQPSHRAIIRTSVASDLFDSHTEPVPKQCAQSRAVRVSDARGNFVDTRAGRPQQVHRALYPQALKI
jgi:hypothetical protein